MFDSSRIFDSLLALYEKQIVGLHPEFRMKKWDIAITLVMIACIIAFMAVTYNKIEQVQTMGWILFATGITLALIEVFRISRSEKKCAAENVQWYLKEKASKLEVLLQKNGLTPKDVTYFVQICDQRISNGIFDTPVMKAVFGSWRYLLFPVISFCCGALFKNVSPQNILALALASVVLVFIISLFVYVTVCFARGFTPSRRVILSAFKEDLLFIQHHGFSEKSKLIISS